MHNQIQAIHKFGDWQIALEEDVYRDFACATAVERHWPELRNAREARFEITDEQPEGEGWLEAFFTDDRVEFPQADYRCALYWGLIDHVEALGLLQKQVWVRATPTLKRLWSEELYLDGDYRFVETRELAICDHFVMGALGCTERPTNVRAELWLGRHKDGVPMKFVEGEDDEVFSMATHLDSNLDWWDADDERGMFEQTRKKLSQLLKDGDVFSVVVLD